MIKCTLFMIGEELLEGSVTDTNSGFIARALGALGIVPKRITALPEDEAEIIRSIQEAVAENDLILTTGGLGPTFDDLTIASIAKAFNLPLIKNEYAAKHIVDRLSVFNVTVSEAQFRQAMFPEGAEVLPNPNGTACIMRLITDGTVIISMPGVPVEMKHIMTAEIIPWLENHFQLKKPFQADLFFMNLPESYADEAILRIGVPEGVRCIINVTTGGVIVKIRSESSEAASHLTEALKVELKDHYVGDNPGGVPQIAVDLLREKGLTLSVAESCTGGLLGGALTSIAGASEVFYGGVISYDNSIKINVLGVSEEIIKTVGAVSAECAEAMANGVKHLMHTDCALSITGIAGPGGGTEEKPVGTVYIGVSTPQGTEWQLFQFRGDREGIRGRALTIALGMLIERVRNAE